MMMMMMMTMMTWSCHSILYNVNYSQTCNLTRKVQVDCTSQVCTVSRDGHETSKLETDTRRWYVSRPYRDRDHNPDGKYRLLS